MAILDLLLGPSRNVSSRTTAYDADGFPLEFLRTIAGVDVDADIALTYAPVFAASRIIAETMALMPRILYERQEDGGRERENDHPTAELVHGFPNGMMAGQPFWEGRFLHADNCGNGFAEIERDRQGNPVALWPIHAQRVRKPSTLDVYRDGRSVTPSDYIVTNNDGTPVAIPYQDMLHIPGVLSEDGIWGKALVDYARESIGFGLATEKHGSSYFRSGGTPKAVLYLPGMKDVQVRNRFREEWRVMHNQDNSGEPVVLPVEGKYEKITHTPEEAQFIQTRAMNVKNIARIWRIPVYMLEEGEHQTFASVEMRGLEFVIYSLLPRAGRVEGQIHLKLLRPEERKTYYVEHLFTSLLRGDFDARMRGYNTAIQNGIMTINEVRRLENLPAIGPAGDVHYIQLNMTTAERMEAGLPPPGQEARTATVEPMDDDEIEEKALSLLADVRKELTHFATSASVPAQGVRSQESGVRSQESGVRDQEADLRAIVADAVRDNMPASKPAADLRPVLLAVAGDVVRRWTFRMAKDCQREIKNADFGRWLEGYINENRPVLSEMLSATSMVLTQMEQPVTNATLADRLFAACRVYLAEGYENETRDQFAKRLKDWPANAGQATKDLLQPWVAFQEEHHP